jgi:hypothetical protein
MPSPSPRLVLAAAALSGAAWLGSPLPAPRWLDRPAAADRPHAAVAEQSAPPTAAAPAADPHLLERFLVSTGEPLVSYESIRRLDASNSALGLKGWLVAKTRLDPERGFEYEVVEEGGSGQVRKRVLHKALETERQAIATGAAPRSALTPDNYTFEPQPAGEDGLARLKLTARRHDVTLMNGVLCLAPAGADLVRLEGVLVKNPSWWTSRVEIVRRYGRIGGVRIPLSMESVAHLKLFGRSAFTMGYQYERINGRPVERLETSVAPAP